MKLEFPTNVLKKVPEVLNLMNISPVAAKLFHADRHHEDKICL
jgi:hypothetical protein